MMEHLSLRRHRPYFSPSAFVPVIGMIQRAKDDQMGRTVDKLSSSQSSRRRSGPFICSMGKELPRRAFLNLLAIAMVTRLQIPNATAEEGPNKLGAEVKASGQDATLTTTEATKVESDIDPDTNEPKITDRVYFDVLVGSGKAPQRFVIGVYGELLPTVVQNFKRLAQNGYADTSVYRIVPGLTIQLGDVLHNNGKSGRAALFDGTPFVPDNFRVSHTIPGIVSMVRTPNGLVDSRFFIATREGDSRYLDGRYAAFGRVVEGMDVVKIVERAGGEGFIRRPVRIVASGILES